MNCKYCQKPTKVLNNIEVCNDCCTVSFSKDIELKQKYYMIIDYLNDIQTKILARKDFFDNIEEHRHSGMELTSKELEIYGNIDKFQSIRVDLEGAIKRNSHLKKKKEQNLLYQLLVLSDWLSEFLGDT